MYFLVIVFVLFLISLSYGHNLAFTTTFIFVSFIIISAYFTNFNLAGLEVLTVKMGQNIHEGESFSAYITLKNTSQKERFDVEASLFGNDSCAPINLYPGETKNITISCHGFSRGHYSGRGVKLSSHFPFGLFRAWKFWHRKFELFVFPRHKKGGELGSPTYPHQESGHSFNKVELGAEEFYGHFDYQEGMPLRSIDWRAYARGRGILLKKFIEQSDGLFLFDIKTIKGPREEKLSLLASSIDQAESRGASYALVLDEEAPHFGKGAAFRRNCLKRLAQYQRKSREIFL